MAQGHKHETENTTVPGWITIRGSEIFNIFISLFTFRDILNRERNVLTLGSRDSRFPDSLCIPKKN